MSDEQVARFRKILAAVAVVAVLIVGSVLIASGGSGPASGCRDVDALNAATNRLQTDGSAGNATAAVGDAQEVANDISSVENDITSASQALQARLATALGYLQTAATEASMVTGDNGESGVAAASVAYNIQHADDAGLTSATC